MAATYTQTIEFSVWKEHKCACCGTVYRYLFKRTMQGEGNSPEAATANAEKAVEKALEHEVDQRPCPECGLYQPDMVASQRGRRHWWTFWAGVPLVILTFILVLTDVFSFATAALLMAGVAIAVTIAHLVIDFTNPNANRIANTDLAKQMVEDGDIWVPKKKQPKNLTDEPIGNGITTLHYFCYAMLAASVVAFLLPVGVPTLTGMKRNADWYPEVAGPGDAPYIYFSDKISTVKGHWSGNPIITILNPQEVGNLNLMASSKIDTWGNTIRIGSKESKTSRPSMWTRVQIPNDPSLIGKTIKMKIDLAVHYPALMGSNQWEPKSTTVSRNAEITLSSSGAGKLYSATFWLGFLSGSGLLLLGGLLLPFFGNRFKKLAHETSIFVPDEQKILESTEPTEEAKAVDAEQEDRLQRRGIRRDRDYDETDDDRPRSRSRRGDEEDEEADDRPRMRSRHRDTEEDEDDDYRDRRPRRWDDDEEEGHLRRRRRDVN